MAAAPRAKISRRGITWALTGIVVDHLTVTRVAAGLGVSWHTANKAIIAEGKLRLIMTLTGSTMSPRSGSTSMSGGTRDSATST